MFSRHPPRPGETPRKSRLPAEHFTNSPRLCNVSPRITVYIKTVGMDPADHGISRELERVDLYKGKVDKALKLGGPNTKLDVPAAGAHDQRRSGWKEEAGGQQGRGRGSDRGSVGDQEEGGQKEEEEMSVLPGVHAARAEL